MSQLILSSKGFDDFKLNVTQFRSPMSASITSAQTRSMLQHFPIRCGQPDVNFTIMFANQADKHAFQNFVRQHQLNAQSMDQDTDYAVTLWWPERNIENWTGYITQYTVVEKRFEVAPTVTFGVTLIDSMMSEKTTVASRGIDIARILGPQIPTYIGYRDTILVRPSIPQAEYHQLPTSVDPSPPAPVGG